MIKHPRFQQRNQDDFSITLRIKINQYFKQHNIKRSGNQQMIIKTIIMFMMFFVPILIINSGIISSLISLILLYILSGLGMAGIGMGVMHDANHGSYSSSTLINKYLSYSMNFIGANATVWKIQHNVLHHSFTNIEDSDDDIQSPFFLRFSPYAKKYWIHRYQHYYAWIFYCLFTVSRVTVKDFVSYKKYHKAGFTKRNTPLWKGMLSIVLWKIPYYSIFLVIPMLVTPYSIAEILLGFMLMHFVAGLFMSIVFQVAHIVPESTFSVPDTGGEMENCWAKHQMENTCNFSPNNKLLYWFIGGLNYQIEHHLLPNVCHIHYKKIAPIVAELAEQHGHPYHSKKSFRSAIYAHFKMLRLLGKVNLVLSK